MEIDDDFLENLIEKQLENYIKINDSQGFIPGKEIIIIGSSEGLNLQFKDEGPRLTIGEIYMVLIARWL